MASLKQKILGLIAGLAVATSMGCGKSEEVQRYAQAYVHTYDGLQNRATAVEEVMVDRWEKGKYKPIERYLELTPEGKEYLASGASGYERAGLVDYGKFQEFMTQHGVIRRSMSQEEALFWAQEFNYIDCFNDAARAELNRDGVWRERFNICEAAFLKETGHDINTIAQYDRAFDFEDILELQSGDVNPELANRALVALGRLGTTYLARHGYSIEDALDIQQTLGISSDDACGYVEEGIGLDKLRKYDMHLWKRESIEAMEEARVPTMFIKTAERLKRDYRCALSGSDVVEIFQYEIPLSTIEKDCEIRQRQRIVN